MNSPPVARGWLWADPDLLERFADGVDELIKCLESLRTRQSDAAWFRSPSTDPATLRVTARLAEDGYDFDGTPMHAITTVIEDLRQQVLAARLAARDHRAREQAVIEDIDRAGGQGA
jgi:hypothetical protein